MRARGKIPPVTSTPTNMTASLTHLLPAPTPVADLSLDSLAADVVAGFAELGIATTVVSRMVSHRMVLVDLSLGKGFRLSDAKRVEKDLAFELGVSAVRITRADSARTVRVEVPRIVPDAVSLREVIEETEMDAVELPLTLGMTSEGDPMVLNLVSAPHVLMAGATGSGKSSALTGMLLGLMMHSTPDAVEFCLIDPKQVDLTPFAKAPHVRRPIATTPAEALSMLQGIQQEMEFRFTELKLAEQPNIQSYNWWASRTAGEEALRYLVVVVDELAALIASEQGKAIESILVQIAQLGRAAGIHMIAATQRPSAQVLSTQLRSQFPTRISFRVASSTDSRIILDQKGAESLLGAGDGLVRLVDGQLVRVQSAYVTRQTVDLIVGTLGIEYPRSSLSQDLPPVQPVKQGDGMPSWPVVLLLVAGAILLKLFF